MRWRNGGARVAPKGHGTGSLTAESSVPESAAAALLSAYLSPAERAALRRIRPMSVPHHLRMLHALLRARGALDERYGMPGYAAVFRLATARPASAPPA